MALRISSVDQFVNAILFGFFLAVPVLYLNMSENPIYAAVMVGALYLALTPVRRWSDSFFRLVVDRAEADSGGGIY